MNHAKYLKGQEERQKQNVKESQDLEVKLLEL